MSLKFKFVGDKIALFLSEIKRSFKPGVRVCFLAGSPDDPEKDIMITIEDDEDIQLFIDILERCKSHASTEEVAIE